MVIDSVLHKSLFCPGMTERYRNQLRLEVLPVMDARAESDYSLGSGVWSEDNDADVLKKYIETGAIKASGIFTYEDERVGTFFYSIFSEKTGDKTLLAVGVGASWNPAVGAVYERIMDAVIKLAKDSGCRWIRAGSTRSSVIRMMLAKGATPVRVEFCMEV